MFAVILFIPKYEKREFIILKKQMLKIFKIKGGCKKREFSTSPFRGMRRSYAKFV